MKVSAAVLAISLIASSCSLAGPAAVVDIEPGRPFSLGTGASAQTADRALLIGFDGVVSDSRCPRGEHCVWAGDAVVKLWLKPAKGPRELHQLHTAPGAGQALRAFGHELRLLRLDPYPQSGKSVAPGAHVVTLVLGAAATADPDR